MKATQAPSAVALRSALLDPAVNILIQKLRQELITTKSKLEDTQNELSAWKFTPDRLAKVFSIYVLKYIYIKVYIYSITI